MSDNWNWQHRPENRELVERLKPVRVPAPDNIPPPAFLADPGFEPIYFPEAVHEAGRRGARELEQRFEQERAHAAAEALITWKTWTYWKRKIKAYL